MAAGRRARFGALRTNEVAKNPSIWDLDVTQSGKVCVAEPTKLSLWRPSKEEATKVTIRSSDGKVQTLSWAAGKATTAWPAALPVTSGAEYQIESDGNSDKSSISFVRVTNPPSDLPGAAQMLIKAGCQNQLDLLVDNASKKG
jgi:phage-related tail fiber protein